MLKKLFFTFSICLFTISTWAVSADITCDSRSKFNALARVKTGLENKKSFFYSKHQECPAGQKKCSQQLKKFVIEKDYVATAAKTSSFICAKFLGFKPKTKATIGWLHSEDLEAARKELNLADLKDTSWVQMPCSNGDESCMITFDEVDNKIEVSLTSYLHDRPASLFTPKSRTEEPGVLKILGRESGEEQSQTIEVTYWSSDLEPGFLVIKNSKNFNGRYRIVGNF